MIFGMLDPGLLQKNQNQHMDMQNMPEHSHH